MFLPHCAVCANSISGIKYDAEAMGRVLYRCHFIWLWRIDTLFCLWWFCMSLNQSFVSLACYAAEIKRYRIVRCFIVHGCIRIVHCFRSVLSQMCPVSVADSLICVSNILSAICENHSEAVYCFPVGCRSGMCHVCANTAGQPAFQFFNNVVENLILFRLCRSKQASGAIGLAPCVHIHRTLRKF